MAPPTGEDRVRSILAVKEYVAKKIEEHEAEIEMLRSNLELLDSTLTRSSFAKASDLLGGGGAAGEAQGSVGRGQAAEEAGGGRPPAGGSAGREDGAAPGGPGAAAEMTSIVGSGGQVLARAHVTDEAVSIVMADGIDVDAESDQIQESLLGKVIGRMKNEDAAAVEDGRMEAGGTIDAKVESDGARLVSITVSRYRERQRSNEIVGMARWAINQLAGDSAGSAAGAGPE